VYYTGTRVANKRIVSDQMTYVVEENEFNEPLELFATLLFQLVLPQFVAKRIYNRDEEI
jgi:hypothetical protein